MALVQNIKEGYKDKEHIHGKTECSFYIVHDKAGRKYLQLDTYGSSNRQIPGKVSQSIQFSPEAIKQLKELILKKF